MMIQGKTALQGCLRRNQGTTDSQGVPEKDMHLFTTLRTSAEESLYAKVNSGEIRVLIGSTGKMARVNVQERAAACIT